MITILNNSTTVFSKIQNVVQRDGTVQSSIESIGVGFNSVTPKQLESFRNDKFFKQAVERGELIVNGTLSDVKEVVAKVEPPKSPVEQTLENMAKPIEVTTKKRYKKKKAESEFKDFD